MKEIKKFIYDESGNRVKEITYGADASLSSSTEYERGADGLLTKSISYDTEGNITEIYEPAKPEEEDNGDYTKYSGGTSYDADGNIIWSHISKNEYDDNENQIKLTTTQMSDYGDGLKTYIMGSEWEYDDNNRMIKAIYYADDGITVSQTCEYAYDSAGNCITETAYDADGSVTSTVDREYDAEGHVIKETQTNADGSGYTLTESEYDNRGNMIKQSTESKYDYYTASYLSEYEYDTDDRQVRYTYYSDGVMKSMSCREYDEHGNMIKDISYNTDETWAGITEYKYMALQDYLAAKESIDQEEIEAVNTESVETLLSDSGIAIAEMAASASTADTPAPSLSSLSIPTATVKIETGGGSSMVAGSSIWSQTYDSGNKMTGGHIGWDGELQNTVVESTDAYGVTYRSYAFKNLSPAENVQSAKNALADYMAANPGSPFTALVKESGSEIVIVTYPALFPDGIEGCNKYPDIDLLAWDCFLVDGKLHILCADNTFDWLEGTPLPDIYISQFLNGAFNALSSMLK
ncbi:MAG: hypothetical protein NC231_12565 [Bacillus sp. (in: Bacteria)]|nr:hypothetical protein [Bacillus sp. (in: firmicutes)]MCM1427917.1 hypothetical protein [Eubacterium sp.]